MTLEEVIKEKFLKHRKELLSKYLKTHEGVLSEEDTKHFKYLFEKYYTPSGEQKKYEIEEIKSVKIGPNMKYGKIYNCFYIYVPTTPNKYEWIDLSYRFLAGEKRQEHRGKKITIYNDVHITKAMRNDIVYQIQEYRNKNKLDPESKCPITGGRLGEDAEVDHETFFRDLKNEWLSKEENKNVTYTHEQNKKEELDEPYRKRWQEFHLENAKLRYVSKKGNQMRKPEHQIINI